MKIGQIFDEMYPQEAAEWANANGAMIVEIEPADGVRRFEIQEIPAPTIEEQNEKIRQTRARLYSERVDLLHAERQRKVVIGTWTEEMEAEYVAKVKELTEQIQTENPYIETVD